MPPPLGPVNSRVLCQQFCNRLPATDDRPAEIKSWIGGGRRYDRGAKFTTAVRAKAYGHSVTQWWCALQPTWRGPKDKWPMSRSAPNDSWETLIRGGHNGLFLVVLALSWLPSLGTFSDSTVDELVDDVLWAMQQMAKEAGGYDDDIVPPQATSSKVVLPPKPPARAAPAATQDDAMAIDDDDDHGDHRSNNRTRRSPRKHTGPPTVENTATAGPPRERTLPRKRKVTEDPAPPAKRQKRPVEPTKKPKGSRT